MGQRIPVTLGNIAPLSLRPFQPGRIALVCEGGGQRGIFTAGVLDEFMRAQFDPFGSLSRHICRGANLWRLSAISPVTRAKSSCAIPQNANFSIHCALSVEEIFIDLDWLVEATASQMPLQMDTAARLFQRQIVLYVRLSSG